MALHLPTLDQVRAKPRACPKTGLPTPLAKKARAKTKAQLAETLRKAIWLRDKGRSRATGKPLVKSGLDWTCVGEVDHALLRSTDPDKVFDVSNGILLSKEENRLRKVRCLQQPEFAVFDYFGPADRAQKQTFVWRHPKTGVIQKTRIG